MGLIKEMERTRGDGGRWALELGGSSGFTQVQSGRLHERREGRVCTQMHSMGEMWWRWCVVVLCRCFHFPDEISSIFIRGQDGRERKGKEEQEDQLGNSPTERKAAAEKKCYCI